jgi:hypothetical protein
LSLQCRFVSEAGDRCPLDAGPGATTCSAHSVRDEADFYSDQLTAADRQALALAAAVDGVDAEIAVLRVLIRRVLSVGDLESARRGIETLCRTLKVRQALDAHGSERLAETLGRVLDTINEDEAMTH